MLSVSTRLPEGVPGIWRWFGKWAGSRDFEEAMPFAAPAGSCCDPFIANWAGKAELHAAKKEGIAGASFGEGAVQLPVPMARVSDEGESSSCEMPPDLMESAGFRANLKNRETTKSTPWMQDRKFEGKAGTGPSYGGERASRLVFQRLREQKIPLKLPPSQNVINFIYFIQ